LFRIPTREKSSNPVGDGRTYPLLVQEQQGIDKVLFPSLLQFRCYALLVGISDNLVYSIQVDAVVQIAVQV